MTITNQEPAHPAAQPLLGTSASIEDQQRNELRSLEEMERRYHSLIRGAVHGFCRTAANGTLVEVNPAMAEMLGYQSEKELIGTNLMAEVYTYPTDAASTLNMLKVEEGITGAEAQWNRKDRKSITVRVSGRRVRAPQKA